MKYLLIGNPNVGKSSLFNIMTNSYAEVGNWSGVTVEKTVGMAGNHEIIDLPGTYSVCPSSEDEGVVSYALLNEDYDGIINVVNASQLKRNLHLTIQLLELNSPLYLAINMIDELRRFGMTLDSKKMASHLGCSVIKTSAKTKEGVDALNGHILTIKDNKPLKLDYDKPILRGIKRIENCLDQNGVQAVNHRFLAIQILEGNKKVIELLDQTTKILIQNIVQETEALIIDNKIALSLKGALFNTRREFIARVLEACVIKDQSVTSRKRYDHKIDRYLTHPVLGMIFFLGVLLLIYFLTFDFLGFVLSDSLDQWVMSDFSPFLRELLESFGVEGAFLSLIIDGVVGGVAGVLIFIPQIAILFFLLAMLEGTGYMARVAIMLDTLLSKFGLNGKSIVPLVTGFGCNVPAILATRTIVDKKERLLTILILPFMSCSARIPIYALIAGNLFANNYVFYVPINQNLTLLGHIITIDLNIGLSQLSLVMISLYIIGVLVALVSAKIFSLSLFKGTNSTFIMEVPPYRVPRLKNALRQTKQMSIHFVEKAGKLILVGTIIVWFLSYIGFNGRHFVTGVSQDDSLLAMVSGFFAPFFRPLGFGSWQQTSGLIIGFLAKEFVASSMIVFYDGALNVSNAFTMLSAYSFMVFSLLYIPCLATVGVIRQETGSIKWTLFSIIFSFSVAYFVSLVIYQIGSLILVLN